MHVLVFASIDKMPNCIINCHHIQPNATSAIIMPLMNSIQLFDGQKAYSICQTKREINAL